MRRGPTQSRDAIAYSARARFAELGYDRTTIRAIAAAAEVDPALVAHFFGSKEALFREVMALPPGVGDALAALADGPRGEVGRRLAEILVGLVENPASRAIVIGRIRSASSHPDAAALVRETVTRDLGRLAAAVAYDHPETRAVLVGSHFVGVVLARHVVRVEPLASMSAPELVELLAPAFQRHLVEPLTG
jgi:AcrR family transcriptional regulator